MFRLIVRGAALAIVALQLSSSATRAGDTHQDPAFDKWHSAPAEMTRAVVLRGRIDEAMTRQVIDALAQGRRNFFIDSSLGGSVLQAAVMAALLKSSTASLTVDGVCYSACALLLFGVERKYYTSEADIRIHGARSPRPVAGQDDDAPARNEASYMVTNGVPPDIAYGPGMGVNLYRLSPQELARIGIAWRGEAG